MSFPFEVLLAYFLIALIFAGNRLPELIRGVGMGFSDLQRMVQGRPPRYIVRLEPLTARKFAAGSLGLVVLVLVAVALAFLRPN